VVREVRERAEEGQQGRGGGSRSLEGGNQIVKVSFLQRNVRELVSLRRGSLQKGMGRVEVT